MGQSKSKKSDETLQNSEENDLPKRMTMVGMPCQVCEEIKFVPKDVVENIITQYGAAFVWLCSDTCAEILKIKTAAENPNVKLAKYEGKSED